MVLAGGVLVGFTALEILGAPLFLWWQARIARAADA